MYKPKSTIAAQSAIEKQRPGRAALLVRISRHAELDAFFQDAVAGGTPDTERPEFTYVQERPDAATNARLCASAIPLDRALEAARRAKLVTPTGKLGHAFK